MFTRMFSTLQYEDLSGNKNTACFTGVIKWYRARPWWIIDNWLARIDFSWVFALFIWIEFKFSCCFCRYFKLDLKHYPIQIMNSTNSSCNYNWKFHHENHHHWTRLDTSCDGYDRWCDLVKYKYRSPYILHCNREFFAKICTRIYPLNFNSPQFRWIHYLSFPLNYSLQIKSRMYLVYLLMYLLMTLLCMECIM